MPQSVSKSSWWCLTRAGVAEDGLSASSREQLRAGADDVLLVADGEGPSHVVEVAELDLPYELGEVSDVLEVVLVDPRYRPHLDVPLSKVGVGLKQRATLR